VLGKIQGASPLDYHAPCVGLGSDVGVGLAGFHPRKQDITNPISVLQEARLQEQANQIITFQEIHSRPTL